MIRGIVLGGRISSTNGFAMNGQIESVDLMRCLLYWDKIAYVGMTLPGGVTITGNHPPEIQFLKDAGVFQSEIVDISTLPRAPVRPADSGLHFMGMSPKQFHTASSLARLQAVSSLSASGSIWALGQVGGEQLLLPGTEDEELIDVTLHQCLPVPADATPFNEILEFKARHHSELVEMRYYLDGLREHILQSVDERRAIDAAIHSLGKSMRAVEQSMRARSIETVGTTVSLYTANPAFGFWSALGAAAAAAAGAPTEIGLSVGGAATTLITFAKRLITGGAHLSAASPEFFYVYKLAKSFPSFGTAATQRRSQ